MTFYDYALHPEILKALDSESLTVPTPVQAAAIPPALEGRDILATAATGTGKTAAFLLPALTRIATTPKNRPAGAPRILVLAPTRELALQVTQAVRKLGKFLRLNSADIVGGMPFRAQLQALSRPLDVVVATPGRLIDHLQRGRLNLAHIDVLVLDEADRMLDMGFAEDVDLIAAACAPEHQTMLFTATLDKRMAKLAERLLKSPVRVAVDAAQSMAPIEQRLYYTNHMGHKFRLLRHFMESAEIGKAIVFVATKRDADTLAQDMAAAGVRAAPLHGDIDQHQRNRTMQQLRQGDVKVLVATDVAARGIDVRDISHVINFDLPRAASDYVHRIGRTGRAGATGIAISFAGPADRGIVRAIEQLTRKSLAVHTVAGLEPNPASTRPAGRPADRAHRPHRPGEGKPWVKHRRPEGARRPHRGQRTAAQGNGPRQA
jgi:superfamily II DNA/RNA helicase